MDVDITYIDLLNVFWEPGIRNIQDSRNLFIVSLVDTDIIESRYPETRGKAAGGGIDIKEYVYDDNIDRTKKSVVIDWYYKKYASDGRHILHYCKFVGDTVIFATENEPEYRERGWYEHGKYPFVFDVLFPEEGVRTLSCEELKLSYRHSLLTERPEAVVLYAEFALTPGDPEQIRETMRTLMAKRKASQPLEWPSAGSTFKRPAGHFAGTLIDQCGLKGLTVGGAQVSEKHAGFLINRGGATFADMTELIRQVQQRVLDAAGVRLEPEVKIVR